MKPRNPVDFLNTSDNRFKTAVNSTENNQNKGPGGQGQGQGLGHGQGLGVGQGLGPGLGRRQSVGGDLSVDVAVGELLGARRGSDLAFKDHEKKVIKQVRLVDRS